MESNSTAFLIKIKLRQSLGRPSRSDFVQAEFAGVNFSPRILVDATHLRYQRPNRHTSCLDALRKLIAFCMNVGPQS